MCGSLENGVSLWVCDGTVASPVGFFYDNVDLLTYQHCFSDPVLSRPPTPMIDLVSPVHSGPISVPTIPVTVKRDHAVIVQGQFQRRLPDQRRHRCHARLRLLHGPRRGRSRPVVPHEFLQRGRADFVVFGGAVSAGDLCFYTC